MCGERLCVDALSPPDRHQQWWGLIPSDQVGSVQEGTGAVRRVRTIVMYLTVFTATSAILKPLGSVYRNSPRCLTDLSSAGINAMIGSAMICGTDFVPNLRPGCPALRRPPALWPTFVGRALLAVLGQLARPCAHQLCAGLGVLLVWPLAHRRRAPRLLWLPSPQPARHPARRRQVGWPRAPRTHKQAGHVRAQPPANNRCAVPTNPANPTTARSHPIHRPHLHAVVSTAYWLFWLNIPLIGYSWFFVWHFVDQVRGRVVGASFMLRAPRVSQRLDS